MKTFVDRTALAQETGASLRPDSNDKDSVTRVAVCRVLCVEGTPEWKLMQAGQSTALFDGKTIREKLLRNGLYQDAENNVLVDRGSGRIVCVYDVTDDYIVCSPMLAFIQYPPVVGDRVKVYKTSMDKWGYEYLVTAMGVNYLSQKNGSDGFNAVQLYKANPFPVERDNPNTRRVFGATHDIVIYGRGNAQLQFAKTNATDEQLVLRSGVWTDASGGRTPRHNPLEAFVRVVRDFDPQLIGGKRNDPAVAALSSVNPKGALAPTKDRITRVDLVGQRINLLTYAENKTPYSLVYGEPMVKYLVALQRWILNHKHVPEGTPSAVAGGVRLGSTDSDGLSLTDDKANMGGISFDILAKNIKVI